jgi:DNA polymerase III subunit delta'
MSLLPVEGHEETRTLLTESVIAGRLPNSLLFHGPPGVGKQRLALWLGQLQLCHAPRPDGPCGDCQPCRMAVRLEHPDLHWFFPLPRPKGAGDRLGDALEEARAVELAARRVEPLRATSADGMAGIFLAHIHVLLRSAASRPAMGRRKVFVIGDAEALVPQESSPEAANALLKLLEEPPADTTVILTAADPGVLLPTIRSRLLPVRVRPLPAADVERFLETHAQAPTAHAQRAARLAQGSIGRAVGFLPQKKDAGPLEDVRAAARSLLEAALAGSAAPRMTAALNESPAGARGAFADVLEDLTVWLRDLAAAATGAHDVLINTDSSDWLSSMARQHPTAAAGVPAAIREVDATLQLTQLNINPQLALAGLLRLLHMRLTEP